MGTVNNFDKIALAAEAILKTYPPPLHGTRYAFKNGKMVRRKNGRYEIKLIPTPKSQ